MPFGNRTVICLHQISPLVGPGMCFKVSRLHLESIQSLKVCSINLTFFVCNKAVAT